MCVRERERTEFTRNWLREREGAEFTRNWLRERDRESGVDEARGRRC